MESLKERIKREAHSLGFSHVGFARAESLPDAPLLNWLSRGYHGTMAYMAREPEARLDPKKILEGCQTVISVAINYYTPSPTKSDESHGRISRYASGRDYHKVIRKKLKTLCRFIQQMAPDAKTKLCADSTPVAEKTWAQKAGIGWQGKHTILITRDYGSWVFLGEILTDLSIPPDPPHVDFCGSCNRCIEACPTQAIPEPYVLDATRCISYWTIENKAVADNPFSKQTGDWIFGCDICQEVCPWNKFAQPTQTEDFFPKLEKQKPLSAWQSMTQEEFVREFAGTPLMRAKLEGMVRNARTAQRNSEKG